MLDAFRFITSQDEQAAAKKNPRDYSDIVLFSSPDVFVREFSTVAPLFSKQVGLRFDFVDRRQQCSASSSSSSTLAGAAAAGGAKPPTMSLADQMRAEMRKQAEEKQAVAAAVQEPQQQQVNSAVEPTAVAAAVVTTQKQELEPTTAQKQHHQEQQPTPALSARDEMMRNRVSGYAPRGRRGHAGLAHPAAANEVELEQQAPQQQHQHQQQHHDIFPPFVRDDSKRTIAVDVGMPAQSERAFHSVMSCVFTALLLRDRPGGPIIMEQQQELAEKAIAHCCVRLAWAFHKNSFIASSSSSSSSSQKQINDDFAALVTHEDVRAILPPFLFDSDNHAEEEQLDQQRQDRQEAALVASIYDTYLAGIKSLLPPLASLVPFALLADAEAAIAKKAKERPPLCSCAQIGGTLENIKWQVVRRSIDLKGDAGAAVRRVLLHWDPLLRMKRQFPSVFDAWVLDKKKKKKEKEKEDEQQGAEKTQPEEDNTSLQRQQQIEKLKRLSSVEKAFGGKNNNNNNNGAGEEYLQPEAKAFALRLFEALVGPGGVAAAKTQPHHQDAASSSSMMLNCKGTDDYDAERRLTNAALQTFASDLALFLTLQQEQEQDQQQQPVDSIEALHVIQTAMRWWAVMLREACSVCSTKVF